MAACLLRESQNLRGISSREANGNLNIARGILVLESEKVRLNTKDLGRILRFRPGLCWRRRSEPSSRRCHVGYSHDRQRTNLTVFKHFLCLLDLFGNEYPVFNLTANPNLNLSLNSVRQKTETAAICEGTSRGSLVADVTANAFLFSGVVFLPKRPLIFSCQVVAVDMGGGFRGGAATIEAKVGGAGGGATAFGGSLTTGFGAGR